MAYVGNQPFGKTVRTTTSETLTSVKTAFYPSGGYTVGYVDVYLNGSKLAEVSDYTATNGSLVTLLFNPEIGDTVEIITYGSVEIANAVRRSGDTMTGDLTINANLVVNGTTSISGSGASLTALNATNISSGTLAKARLPAGSVLQVVQTTKTDSFSTISTSYTTFISVSITPISSSSKILVTFGTNGGTAGDVAHGYLAIFRGATQLFQADTAGSRRGATSVINTATQQQLYYGGTFLDSPATTSSTTYTIQVLSSNGTTIYLNRSGRDNDALAFDGRSVSSITVMEIAA